MLRDARNAMSDDTPDDVSEATLAWIERLHVVVDELAEPILARHHGRLACRSGCAGCCADDLTVFDIEAAVLRRRYPELLANGTPRAPGACAFLDEEDRCRVYRDRPYVCRTQGLPLRWLDEDEEGATFEARDVCPLSAEGEALEDMPADALWTLGPFEQRLAAKQAESGGPPGGRVALRSLFATSSPAPRRLPVVD